MSPPGATKRAEPEPTLRAALQLARSFKKEGAVTTPVGVPPAVVNNTPQKHSYVLYSNACKVFEYVAAAAGDSSEMADKVVRHEDNKEEKEAGISTANGRPTADHSPPHTHSAKTPLTGDGTGDLPAKSWRLKSDAAVMRVTLHRGSPPLSHRGELAPGSSNAAPALHITCLRRGTLKTLLSTEVLRAEQTLKRAGEHSIAFLGMEWDGGEGEVGVLGGAGPSTPASGVSTAAKLPEPVYFKLNVGNAVRREQLFELLERVLKVLDKETV